MSQRQLDEEEQSHQRTKRKLAELQAKLNTKVSDYEAQLEFARGQTDSYSEQVHAIQKQKTDQDSFIEEMQSEMTEMRQRVTDAESKAEAAQRQTADYFKQLGQLQEQKHQQDLFIEEMEAELAEMHQQVADAESKAKSAQRKTENSLKDFGAVQEQNYQQGLFIEGQKNELTELRERVTKTEAKAETAYQEAEQAKSETKAALGKAKQDISSQADEFNNQIHVKDGRISTLTEELRAANESAAWYEQHHEAAQIQISKVESEMGELRRTHELDGDDARTTAASLHKTIDDNKKSIGKLTNDLEVTKNDLDAQITQNRELRSKFERDEAESSERHASSVSELNKKLKAAEDNAFMLKQDIADLEADIKHEIGEREARDVELGRQRQLLEATTSQYEELQRTSAEEKSGLEQELQALQKSHTDINDSFSELEANFSRTSADLTTKTEDLVAAQNAVSESKLQIQALQRSSISNEQHQKELEGQLQHAQSEQSRLRESLEQRTAELEVEQSRCYETYNALQQTEQKIQTAANRHHEALQKLKTTEETLSAEKATSKQLRATVAEHQSVRVSTYMFPLLANC